MPYVGGFDAYKRRCDAVAAGGYEGFRLTRQRVPVREAEAAAPALSMRRHRSGE
jgi:hypothetical protein